MDEKPNHLQPRYAAQFHDASVVAAYGYRWPVPDEVFTVLLGLDNKSEAIVLRIETFCGNLGTAIQGS